MINTVKGAGSYSRIIDQGLCLRIGAVLALDQGGSTPEFFSTHPTPASRITQIQQDIQDILNYPQ